MSINMHKELKKDHRTIPLDEVNKQSTQRAKEEIQSKVLTSEPHPKDRHSGTGRGKEMRKNGAGKHNWGNYIDDMKDYGIGPDQNEQPARVVLQEKNCSTVPQCLVVDDINFPRLG